jgi:hypothetical protein
VEAGSDRWAEIGFVTTSRGCPLRLGSYRRCRS